MATALSWVNSSGDGAIIATNSEVAGPLPPTHGSAWRHDLAHPDPYRGHDYAGFRQRQTGEGGDDRRHNFRSSGHLALAALRPPCPAWATSDSGAWWR